MVKCEGGVATQYKFLYRSHSQYSFINLEQGLSFLGALQYLGCIPTTLEPVPLSERPPTDMTGEERVTQIIELRVSLQVFD